MKHSKNFIIYFVLFVSINCYSSGNREDNDAIVDDYIYETIIVDTGIEYIQNKTGKIFIKIKDIFMHEGIKMSNEFVFRDNNKNVFIINSLNDLEIFQEENFRMTYFNEFDEDFFSRNILVLIFQSWTGGYYLQNERVEEKNNKYILIIEKWKVVINNKIAAIPAMACEALYILQLPKEDAL
jgi:hypothetical protein